MFWIFNILNILMFFILSMISGGHPLEKTSKSIQWHHKRETWRWQKTKFLPDVGLRSPLTLWWTTTRNNRLSGIQLWTISMSAWVGQGIWRVSRTGIPSMFSWVFQSYDAYMWFVFVIDGMFYVQSCSSSWKSSTKLKKIPPLVQLQATTSRLHKRNTMMRPKFV